MSFFPWNSLPFPFSNKSSTLATLAVLYKSWGNLNLEGTKYDPNLLSYMLGIHATCWWFSSTIIIVHGIRLFNIRVRDRFSRIKISFLIGFLSHPQWKYFMEIPGSRNNMQQGRTKNRCNFLKIKFFWKTGLDPSNFLLGIFCYTAFSKTLGWDKLWCFKWQSPFLENFQIKLNFSRSQNLRYTTKNLGLYPRNCFTLLN